MSRPLPPPSGVLALLCQLQEASKAQSHYRRRPLPFPGTRLPPLRSLCLASGLFPAGWPLGKASACPSPKLRGTRYGWTFRLQVWACCPGPSLSQRSSFIGTERAVPGAWLRGPKLALSTGSLNTREAFSQAAGARALPPAPSYVIRAGDKVLWPLCLATRSLYSTCACGLPSILVLNLLDTMFVPPKPAALPS